MWISDQNLPELFLPSPSPPDTRHLLLRREYAEDVFLSPILEILIGYFPLIDRSSPSSFKYTLPEKKPPSLEDAIADCTKICDNQKLAEDNEGRRAYLIFVIFFTQAKFLENKIYTKKMRKLRQNAHKIANFLRYYSKIHSKLPIFRVKSVKNYTGQKNKYKQQTNMRYAEASDWGSDIEMGQE